MSRRLAAVVPYFNPCAYRRVVEKYERFRAAFHGCDLFVVEAGYGGRFDTDADFRIEATEEQVLWQKERMIRLATSWLPDRYDRVVWIDADLLFLSADWAGSTAELLDDCVFVQPFQRVHLTDRRGRLAHAQPSAVQSLADSGSLDGVAFAPGFAWAGRREVVERHGIAEFDVIGGGDNELLNALIGRWNTLQARRMNRTWRRHWLEWGRQLWEDVRGRVGVVAGDLVHLWHGTRQDRRYVGRYRFLSGHDYDPSIDVRVAENGLLEWASDKPGMHADVRRYFGLRREDEAANVTTTTDAHRLPALDGVHSDQG